MLLCIYVFLSFSLTITVGCNGLASYLVKAQCYNAPASYAVVVQFKVTVAGRRQHVNMYSKTWIYILRVTISEKPHYTGPKMDWIRLLLAIKAISQPLCAVLLVWCLASRVACLLMCVILTLNLKAVNRVYIKYLQSISLSEKCRLWCII